MAPAVFVVNTVQDLPAFAGGSTSLRSAVLEANALGGSHTIILPAGHYQLSVPGRDTESAATGDLDLYGKIEIRGSGTGETVLDAAGLDRIFDVHPGANVTLSGVTLVNGGAADGDGGAIRNAGRLTLHRVRFLGNTARDGGALANLHKAVAKIDASTFDGNSADDGGAIVNRGTLSLDRSAVVRNTAHGRGGGVWNDGQAADFTARNLTLSTNTADRGGGLANSDGVARLDYATVAKNSAGRGGGGAANLSGTVILGTSLVGTNQAGEDPDLSGTFTSVGFNLVQQPGNAGWIGSPVGNQFGPDPRLGPLTVSGRDASFHPLLPGSPAIDAGSVPPGGVFVDQLGRLRRYDRPEVANAPGSDASDIGAIEFVGGTAVVNSLDDGDVRDGFLTLREALGLANRTLAYDALTADEKLQIDGDPGSLDRIEIPLVGVIHLKAPLPALPARMELVGSGADRLTVRRAAPAVSFRIFDVPFGAVATLRDLTVAGGSAHQGGNLRNFGELDLISVHVTGGSANEGGGLYTTGPVYARGSTFAFNTAQFGGGIGGPGGLTLRASTVSNNSGGGVRIRGSAEFSSVTIARNQGGGLIVEGAVARAINTLFADNWGGSVQVKSVGSFHSLGHNLATDAPASFQRPGDRTLADARIAPLTAVPGSPPVHPLLLGSAAIDAGVATPYDLLDQRGRPRSLGSAPDVGAVEARPYTLVAVSGGDQSAMLGRAFAPLRVRLVEDGVAIAGVPVTFELPIHGPTAVASGSLTVVTDEFGFASSPTLTAAGDVGAFTVRARVGGSTSVAFLLTNTPAPVAVLSLATAATATAGDTIVVSLIVRDQFDSPMTDFTGTVQLSLDDPRAVGGGPVVFTAADQGRRDVPVSFRTAGPRTITATGSGFNVSANLNVAPAAATRFDLVNLPPSVRAGDPVSFVVIARDGFGNRASGYRGSVEWASDDPLATAPAAFAFTAADQGAASLSAVFRTAGPRTFTVRDTADASVRASASIDVTPAAAVIGWGGLPTSVVAGQPIPVTLTVRDGFGNPLPDFLAAAAVQTTDPVATVPAIAFTPDDGGSATGTLTLRTAGLRQVTVAISGQTFTAAVNVLPAAADRFELTGLPTTAIAGQPFILTVTAFDPFGNRAAGFGGTVSVSTTDPAVPTAGAISFTAADAGRVQIPIALFTTGPRTVTIGDGSIAATSGEVRVLPAAPVVAWSALPAFAVAGEAVTLTLSARDAFGNPSAGFTGSVVFASSDSQASLPSGAAFSGGDDGRLGVGVTFRTAGARSVTALVNGQELTATVAVRPAALGRIDLTAPPAVNEGESFAVTLDLFDAFGNRTTNFAGDIFFTSGDPSAVVPGPAAVRGDRWTVTGWRLAAIGPATVTAFSPDGPSASANLTVVNVPIEGVTIALDRSIVEEGSPVRLTGRVIDPGPPSAVTVTIDWGDGRGDVIRLEPGVRFFAASHAFADDGQYRVVVTATDPQGVRAAAPTTATVTNVAPVFTAVPEANVILFAGEQVGLTAGFFDPGADEYTFEIDFGDGRPPITRPLAAPGAVPFGLRFDEEGTFTVRLTVRDDDGGSSTATFRALVLPAGTENVRILLIAPGTVGRIQTKGARAAYSNRGDGDDPAVLVIGTLSARRLPVAVEGESKSYELRTANSNADDVATLTFAVPPRGDPLSIPEIRFFDRETNTFRELRPSSRVADAIRFDPVRRTITVVFDATSFPKVTELRGTIFTITVPTAPQPSTLVYTLQGQDGAGVTAVLAGGPNARGASADNGPAPTTGLTGGGELTLTLAPSEGLRRYAAADERKESEPTADPDWVKWARVATRLAEVMQDWMEKTDENTANPVPVPPPPARPVESKPEPEVNPDPPPEPMPEGNVMFDDDRLGLLIAATVLPAPERHDQIPLPPIEEVSRSATAWWVVDADPTLTDHERVPLEPTPGDRSAALAAGLWMGGVALQTSWPDRARDDEEDDEDSDDGGNDRHG